jgi:2-iminobutanoate/2-iminopropanoate deaminase
MANVAAILEAAGSSLNRVLKATIYVSDMNMWGAVNQVYARIMGEHRPARAVVPVRELHHGFQVEVEVIAALSD